MVPDCHQTSCWVHEFGFKFPSILPLPPPQRHWSVSVQKRSLFTGDLPSVSHNHTPLSHPDISNREMQMGILCLSKVPLQMSNSGETRGDLELFFSCQDFLIQLFCTHRRSSVTFVLTVAFSPVCEGANVREHRTQMEMMNRDGRL